MPILAAIPAIAGVASAASGLAGTGMAIGNAINQGNNPGTAPIDQSVGQLDQGAYGYGGGIMSPEQQALRGEFQSAQQARDSEMAAMQGLQQDMLAGQKALDDQKIPELRSPEQRRAIERMTFAMTALPAATQRAEKARAAFDTVNQKMQNAPSLAQSEADRYRGLAGAADARQGVQMNLDNYNQARGQSQSALGLAQAAAEGNAPSVAAMQMRQGLDQANNQAAGLAASARGGGGNLALASRAALQQQGQNSMLGVQNAAMLRANEMAQARQQYMQGAQQLQQTDLAHSGQQAALDAQQRQMNDARNQQYEQGLQRIYGAQQQGMSGYQQQQAANRYQIESANRGLADKRFADTQNAWSGAAQMAGRTADGLSKMDFRSDDQKQQAAERQAANDYRVNQIRTTGKV